MNCFLYYEEEKSQCVLGLVLKPISLMVAEGKKRVLRKDTSKPRLILLNQSLFVAGIKSRILRYEKQWEKTVSI